MGVLMALIMEFDEPNADMLWNYLKSPRDASRLMEGVLLGSSDYRQWATSAKGAGPTKPVYKERRR